MPRMNSSPLRSLSNRIVRGENFCACAARKFITTVLPEPDGPMIEKLPRSPWWKLKKNGVALVVSSSVTASPQWLPSAWPSAKPCRLPKLAMLAVEIIARRTRYCSLPGNCPQNAGSRLVSSRTAIAHHHGQVVIAEPGRADPERVTRGEHLAAFGDGVFVGRTQAAQRKIHP